METSASRLSFRCDASLVAAVDAARGGVPRERWLRDVVSAALGGVERSPFGSRIELSEETAVLTAKVPDTAKLAAAVKAAPVPVVRGSQLSPRPKSGTCEHRVPAGSFCKKCAEVDS